MTMKQWIKDHRNGLVAIGLGLSIGYAAFGHGWPFYSERKNSEIEVEKVGDVYRSTFTVPDQKSSTVLKETIEWNADSYNPCNDLVEEIEQDHMEKLIIRGRTAFTSHERYQVLKQIDDPKYAQHIGRIVIEEVESAENLRKNKGIDAFRIKYDKADLDFVRKTYFEASAAANSHWEAAKQLEALTREQARKKQEIWQRVRRN